MAGAEPSFVVDGAIATITLRRSTVANRLELEDPAPIRGFLEAADAERAVRVLRLRGEGPHFCSGFNIERAGADGAGTGPRFETVADALEQARPVTAVALQGRAYAGAMAGHEEASEPHRTRHDRRGGTGARHRHRRRLGRPAGRGPGVARKAAAALPGPMRNIDHMVD